MKNTKEGFESCFRKRQGGWDDCMGSQRDAQQDVFYFKV